METHLMKPSKTCEDCGSPFNKNDHILFYNKNDKKWLCYNCTAKYALNYDILCFKYINDDIVKLIRTGTVGAGIPTQGKPSMDISVFLSELNHPKCQHAIKYLFDTNVIFFCKNCKQWICADCLYKHEKHGIITNYGINGQILQLVPVTYDCDVNSEEINIQYKIPKKINIDKDFPLLIEVYNNSEESIHHVQILLGIPSDFGGYEFQTINQIKLINGGFSEKISCIINLIELFPNLNIGSLERMPIKISIGYEDYFDAYDSIDLDPIEILLK